MRPATTNKKSALLFLAAVIPFFLNDFSNIYVTDYRLWLAIDYTCAKLLPFCLVLALIRKGELTWRELGLKRIDPRQMLVFSAVLSITRMAITQLGDRLLWHLIPSYRAGSMPAI